MSKIRTAEDAQHHPQPGDRWRGAVVRSPEGHETAPVHTIERIEGDVVHVVCTYTILPVDWSSDRDDTGAAGTFEPGTEWRDSTAPLEVA